MDDSLKALESCKTFSEATDLAKLCAKEYQCEATVAFDSANNRWNILIPVFAEAIYTEREQARRNRRFDQACEPDPNFEDEDPVRPVFGNDWSQI